VIDANGARRRWLPALVADTSISGLRVVRELEAVVAARGAPILVVSDELVSLAVLRWKQESGVEWRYIAPGKPPNSTARRARGSWSAHGSGRRLFSEPDPPPMKWSDSKYGF
jgi:hypothetical protein